MRRECPVDRELHSGCWKCGSNVDLQERFQAGRNEAEFVARRLVVVPDGLALLQK